MAEEYFPFDAGPGADSTEARWRRMARLWTPSGVVGVPGSTAYNLTVSGLTATLARGSSGVAEAWVDGFMHRLVTADWSQAVTANANANPRIDRLVLRLDQTANTVVIARKAGTPAAVPTAPDLTQTDNGVWEIPLWRFTVPANSAAPLTDLTDERFWVDPTGTSGPRGVIAFGSSASGTSTAGRVIGGLNVVPILTPGRIYEVEWTFISSGVGFSSSLRAIAGSAVPTTGTGTPVGSTTTSVGGGVSLTLGQTMTAKFTVGTPGPYAISPFLGSGNLTAPSGGMTLVVRDAGSAISIPGTTPTLVP